MNLAQLHNIYKIDPSQIETLSVETSGLRLGSSLVEDRRLPLFGFTPENINMLLVPMLTNQYVILFPFLLHDFASSCSFHEFNHLNNSENATSYYFFIRLAFC